MAIADRNIYKGAKALKRTLTLGLPGEQSAAVTAAWSFYIEDDWIVSKVSATNSAKGGTQGVANFDVLDDGVSILSTLPDLTGTAAAKAAGILTTTTGVTIASGSLVTINFGLSGGSSPTQTSPTVHITYRTKAAGESRTL